MQKHCLISFTNDDALIWMLKMYAESLSPVLGIALEVFYISLLSLPLFYLFKVRLTFENIANTKGKDAGSSKWWCSRRYLAMQTVWVLYFMFLDVHLWDGALKISILRDEFISVSVESQRCWLLEEIFLSLCLHHFSPDLNISATIKWISKSRAGLSVGPKAKFC